MKGGGSFDTYGTEAPASGSHSGTLFGCVLQNIYERGQLRRQKMKGGGCFNAYGSEGPASGSHDYFVEEDSPSLWEGAGCSHDYVEEEDSPLYGFSPCMDSSSEARIQEATAFLEPLNSLLEQTGSKLSLEPLPTQGDGFSFFSMSY